MIKALTPFDCASCIFHVSCKFAGCQKIRLSGNQHKILNRTFGFFLNEIQGFFLKVSLSFWKKCEKPGDSILRKQSHRFDINLEA